jgi:hypothetical protein
MTPNQQNMLYSKYKTSIKELEKLMGCKFVRIDDNPETKTPSEQWAMFAHDALGNVLKHVQLTKIADRIKAFHRDGFNIFTADSKSNQGLLKQQTPAQEIRVWTPKSVEMSNVKVTTKDVFAPVDQMLDKNDLWKTIGCKVKVVDAIALEKIAYDNGLTLSGMIRGYLQNLLKKQQGGKYGNNLK